MNAWFVLIFSVISPQDPLIAPGSNLDILCTCTIPFCSSSNIVWRNMTKGTQDLDPNHYTTVNKTTSKLSLYDIRTTDQRYGCCMADDTQRIGCFFSMTNVHVGGNKGPVSMGRFLVACALASVTRSDDGERNITTSHQHYDPATNWLVSFSDIMP